MTHFRPSGTFPHPPELATRRGSRTALLILYSVLVLLVMAWLAATAIGQL